MFLTASGRTVLTSPTVHNLTKGFTPDSGCWGREVEFCVCDFFPFSLFLTLLHSYIPLSLFQTTSLFVSIFLLSIFPISVYIVVAGSVTLSKQSHCRRSKESVKASFF